MAHKGKQFGWQYLYAIADADAVAAGCGDGTLGMDGAPVAVISDGPIAAVVSSIAGKRIRPERSKVSVHHGVIKRLMVGTTILPVAFGTIADSLQAVRGILVENRAVFLEQLTRVRGNLEMGLHVTWDVPNIFEYVVARHPELADLRDSVQAKQRDYFQGGRADKIELGRLFDRLLNQDRELYTEAVLKVLSPYCVEILQKPLRKEKEVMHLACLIDRKSQKRFEDGVFEAAKLFDDKFALDFNGPWAPHYFVNVAIEV